MNAKRAQDSDHIGVPPEWAAQQALWTAWPSHADLWQENLVLARQEIAAMVLALAEVGTIKVLAMGEEALSSARQALQHPKVAIVPADFGDIWLRDTGPIFAHENGHKVALTFQFNGWGGKYLLPYDDQVASFIAELTKTPKRVHDFVIEGGALEHDGEGTILTTRECLLNPNRNPGFSEAEVEKRLHEAFGAKRIIWLEQGLCNDHTDGHVDNLARFVAPGHVLCQSASGDDDPNVDVLNDIAAQLEAAGLKVTRIPSPGRITNDDKEPVAASHMNYIIFNGVIVLPSYEEKYSAQAVAALQKVFPFHRIIASPARHVLSGGGSFHCITQQEF